MASFNFAPAEYERIAVVFAALERNLVAAQDAMLAPDQVEQPVEQARRNLQLMLTRVGELLAIADGSPATPPTADPLAGRFKAQGHRYPDLVQVGMGHLWSGPGWNDFVPELIDAVQNHLHLYELPAQRGHACDYIRNRIRSQDWGALEQRWAEAKQPQQSQAGASESMKRAMRRRYGS
jgi:hypothetical protein